MTLNTDEVLTEMGLEGCVYFSSPSFNNAIIGVSTDNRLIYDYDKMIECLMEDEHWSYEESQEWIEYNTIRSLDYFQDGPIIMYRIEDIQ